MPLMILDWILVWKKKAIGDIWETIREFELGLDNTA